MSTGEHEPIELDAHRALYEITRALRINLERLGQRGVFAAPAADTTRPDDVDWRTLPTDGPLAPAPSAQPQEARARQPGAASGVTPDEDGPSVNVEEALGFSSMSEALAHALGEPDGKARPASRERGATASIPRAEDPVGPRPAEPAPAQRPTLDTVRAELGDCTRCKLAPTRTQLVFGVGHGDADLMFIGEAPGEQEDLRGEPFVGPAGQLLDKMIAAMGWSRDTVYIANVLKCRPPGNRDPQPDEVAACRPFLERQIAAVGPRLIITLGKPAAHLVLDTNEPMWRLRGRFYRYQGIPVMPTYHPSYLLRNNQAKRDAWADLKQVIAELQRMDVRSPFPAKT